MLLRVPEDAIDSLTRDLQTELRPQFVRVRSYRDRQEQIGEDFERAENYLSLVGLVIVVLGGIAVSSVTRVFVRQKIKSIAVMKCVGGTSRQILSVYLLQALALGLVGSLLGVALAALAIAAIPDDLNQIGTLTVPYGLSWSAALQGLGIGVLVSLLFAMVPLLEVRQVKPSLLLRQETAGAAPRLVPDWRDGGRRGRARGAGVVAGGVAACRPERLPRVRRAHARAARRRLAADAHDAAAGPVALVSAAAGGAASQPPGQSDAGDSADRGLGTFFIMGVRGLQVNLLEPVRAADRRQHAGSVPRRHSAGSGGRHEGFLAERLPPESQPL